MKKTLIFAAMFVLLAVVSTYAADHYDMDVRAHVPEGTPDIQVEIIKCNGWDPAQIENPWLGERARIEMNFGELIHVYDPARGGGEAGQWYAQHFFFVPIWSTSFGKEYQITSTIPTSLQGPNGTLPDGSFGMVPGYSADDLWDEHNPNSKQGPPIARETLGGSRAAPHTDVMIWRSHTARNRIIRAFYSIPLPKEGGYPPWSNYHQVPLDQHEGDYGCTATITIAAI